MDFDPSFLDAFRGLFGAQAPDSTQAQPAPPAPDTLAMPGPVTAVNGQSPDAFIVHHTGGRGSIEGVQQTLRDRGLGVQYVMDRDGNITQIGGPGSQHMRPGWGAGAGLSNGNTVGMEVIAQNDKDVTPAQVAAAQAFIAKNYPGIRVFGHGEVNPGHKEADEGMTIVNAIRNGAPPSQIQTVQAAPVPSAANPNSLLGANAVARAQPAPLPLFGGASVPSQPQPTFAGLPAPSSPGASGEGAGGGDLSSLLAVQAPPAPPLLPAWRPATRVAALMARFPNLRRG